MTTAEDILAHHGTKGMKWGVRNDKGHEGEQASGKTIAKADKKFEKSFSPSMSNWIKVNNTFAKHINPMLDELNNRPEYKDKNLYDSRALHDKYFKDYEKVVAKAAAKTTEEFGTNASGNRQMKVTKTGFGENTTWEAQLVDVQHDDTNSFTIIPTFDANGHIIASNIKPNSFMHSEDLVSNILEHHGIKGMKWGVRSASSSSGGSSGSSTKTKSPAHEDALHTKSLKTKAKTSGTDSLSNAELKKAIERMNLEQQYSRLTGQGGSPSRAASKFITDQLKNIGRQQVGQLGNQLAAKQIAKLLAKSAVGA